MTFELDANGLPWRVSRAYVLRGALLETVAKSAPPASSCVVMGEPCVVTASVSQSYFYKHGHWYGMEIQGAEFVANVFFRPVLDASGAIIDHTVEITDFRAVEATQ